MPSVLRFSWLVLAVLVFCALPVAAQTTIQLGLVNPPEHPIVLSLQEMAEEVRTETGGAIDIRVFPAAQLGSGHEMVESTIFGLIDGVTEGAALMAQWAPRLSVLEAPYLFDGPDHMYRVLDSEVGRSLMADLEQNGLKVLGVFYYGARHLTTTNREVRTPADMAGFKLRVPEVPLYLEMAHSWGASPTPMAFSELYFALRQGLVDGQENPLPTIKSGAFHEVQEYLVLTGHIIVPMITVVNKGMWDRLSAEHQQIISAAMDRAVERSNGMIIAQEQSLIEEFRAHGVKVIEPDLDAFRAAVADRVPQAFASIWGPDLYARIRAVE